MEVSLEIVTQADIAAMAVMDDKAPAREGVTEWIKTVIEAVEGQYKEETRKRTVVVQATIYPDRAAEVAVAGRPGPSEAETKAILKVADAGRLPRSRAAACVLRVVAEVNGGDPSKDQPVTPALVLPSERRMAEFREATIAGELAILKNWARVEAIPTLAQMASDVDPKYQGVRALGRAMQGVKPEGPVDEDAISDKNPMYWRAMLEMAPGTPLVPASRVALHAANGEIGAAARLSRVLARFDRHQSGYSAVLAEFAEMADAFARAVDSRIRKGIALHDAGKLDEALAEYDALLREYPNTAWGRYERHQTLMAKAMRDAPDAMPAWPPTRKAILRADALYESMAQASTGDELYDLLLRKEAGELFRDPARTVPDLLRLADIAVDLDQPATAALIYWNLVTNVQPAAYQDRPLIESTLYCFEELGATALKSNFKGDHAAEFARIDADRARRRKDSPANKMQKDH